MLGLTVRTYRRNHAGEFMQRIEVITNFKSNTILLKQGRFFIQCDLTDADGLLEEITNIKNIMQDGIARRLLPEQHSEKKTDKAGGG